MTKSIQRQIDEHLGLGGPKPKIPTQWLASEMEEIAEREREHDANNVFLLEEAAARLVHLEDALVFVRPALAVLRNMCRTAGLKAGEAKAEEINQHLRAVLTAEDPRDPHPTREGMFRLHDCSRCNDGALPCKQGNPRQCEFPHARDD